MAMSKKEREKLALALLGVPAQETKSAPFGSGLGCISWILWRLFNLLFAALIFWMIITILGMP